jgi:hypothetical protein
MISIASRYQAFRRHPWWYMQRHSLIVRLGSKAVFEDGCTNRHVQPDEIPPLYRAYAAELDPKDGSNLDRARAIAYGLSHDHPRGSGLGVTSTEALEQIMTRGGGVCSDYAQVFLGLCLAAGIPVREWGVNYEGLCSGAGHSFNEIYSEEHRKWVLIDSYRSLCVIDRSSGAPLSVEEVIHTPPDELEQTARFDLIDEPHRPVRRPGKNFLRPASIYFLLLENNVFRQDRFLRFTGLIPRPLLHLLLLGTGNYYHYYLYTAYSGGDFVTSTYAKLRSRFHARRC